MKKIFPVLLFVLITSCASNKAQTSLTNRGVSDEDKTEIMTQFNEYSRIMSKSRRGTSVGFGFGGLFGGGLGGGVGVSGSRGADGTADQNVQKVLCVCHTKLEDKCLSSSKEAPTGDLKSLWIKGHAAKLAHEKYETGLDDKVMCN